MFLHTRLEKGRERERDAGDKFFLNTDDAENTRSVPRHLCFKKGPFILIYNQGGCPAVLFVLFL
jgi:hypothetical protein